MVGSGIYGLIGKAAGEAGSAVWLSFLVALVGALLTSLSYASLGSRYPRAGGAAYVTERAFGLPVLSFTIGLALVASGLTSIATQSKIFAAIIARRHQHPRKHVGQRRLHAYGSLGTSIGDRLRPLLLGHGRLLRSAAPTRRRRACAHRAASFGADVLRVHRKDAVNVAEECRDPERTIPRGLIIATLAAAFLYVAVSITAVSVVPWRELSAAPSPLTAVMQRSLPSLPAEVMNFIALFSVANTALVNYVTASRMIYGMSGQGLLPNFIGRVHETRRTPHIAIGALLGLLLLLATAGQIADLAAATVLLLLVVFITVNTSLVVLKRRPGEPRGRFEIPVFIPVAGIAVCAILLSTRLSSSDWRAPALAAALLAASSRSTPRFGWASRTSADDRLLRYRILSQPRIFSFEIGNARLQTSDRGRHLVER